MLLGSRIGTSPKAVKSVVGAAALHRPSGYEPSHPMWISSMRQFTVSARDASDSTYMANSNLPVSAGW